ncbi:MAG: ADP-ribosylglycohydrolase family protein [Phycisphaerae bacterium]|nr:ADP-ribosylglycohydrolase family protein [Phycisphaerae bacterium]
MDKFMASAMVMGVVSALSGQVRAAEGQFRRLPLSEYVDKMKAGWIGQMVGVGWGAPTEFKYNGRIIPEDKMPKWHPRMVNQFGQDDLYVEMTFLRSLELHGLDVSIRQAGIDFANSRYRLWHANRAGRDNLRAGIAPPDSGHPRFNKHADDIDYQIEADFSGLIAPGLPNTVIALGEKFGRLMNYGDGVYGGQFVGGMIAEAFFENDPVKIVRAGLRCIPPDSQYAETVRDVLKWHQECPDDWVKTWKRIDEKYHHNPAYRRFSCSGAKAAFNIDAKINGAYIVVGLLYGERNPDRTIIISTRCGQDSDCNPSNAGGILLTTMGMSSLPAKFTSALDTQGKFSHTPYDFPTLVSVCEKLARQAVAAAGGKTEKDAAGEEVLVIPVQAPRPGKLEQSWQPGPVAESRFTEQERARIVAGRPGEVDLGSVVEQFAPGWKVSHCGQDMDPGLWPEWGGKKKVLVTHPLNQTTGCVLAKTVDVPAGKKTTLRLVVGHHPNGDWLLVVRADGRVLLERTVGKDTAKSGWLAQEVDLTPCAGKSVKLELINQPSGWMCEAGYWAEIKLIVQ